MHHLSKLAVIAATSAVLAGTAHADEALIAAAPAARSNSINLSPIGFALGAYNLNYERLLPGGHGFLVEAGFSSYGDDTSSASSAGGAAGYRWHWRGRQNSGFVGLTVGYSVGSGEATVREGDMSETFDLDVSAFTVTANVGKRWAWDWGLNITFRVGAGYGDYTVSSDSTDPDVQEAIDLVQDVLTLLPVAIDGELSVGYTF